MQSMKSNYLRVSQKLTKVGMENAIDSLPREKMMRLSAAELSDAELLAIILRTGTSSMNVLQVANNLLHKYGSLYELFRKDWSAVSKEHGIGVVKSLELNAVFELARRSIRKPFYEYSKFPIKSPTQFAEILFPIVKADPRETFFVFPLDKTRKPLCEPIRLTRGSSESTVVDPYDVIREVILRGGRRFVVAHNHPDCTDVASHADLILTKELIRLANAIKIPIDDHIIVWDDGSDMLGCISMRMKKIINFEEE